jgi:hypothetical protein
MKVPFYFLPALGLLTMAAGCHKTPIADPAPPTANTLVAQYTKGEVSRCRANGQLYYSCAHNAADGGNEIFDSTGVKIAGCYYNTGSVSALCDQLTECVVIYRVTPNIWGKPGVEFKP